MALDGFEILEKLLAKEAERVILGAILLDNDLMRGAYALTTTDFAEPFHRAVFAAMLELDEENRIIDPILIHAHLKAENPHTDWMVSSVTNLTYGLPFFWDIRAYVAEVRDVSARRMAVKRIEKIAQDLGEKKLSLKKFCAALSTLESELRDQNAEETDSFRPLSAIIQSEVLPTLEAYFKREVSEFLIPTGFAEIDEILNGGLYLSDFLAIVAPPKSAKSAFVLQLALNFARRGETVGLLSLEMSNLQNGLRFIVQKSYTDSIEKNATTADALNASWLRPGLYESTYKQAAVVAASLFETNLYLCQKPLHWSEVQAETRRLVKGKNLRVLIVDYWQLVVNQRRGQTRTENLAEIAKGLKALGQELNICIVALGQFNQEGLKVHRATGELSALYLEGSGELVKSANIVLTLDIKPADLDRKGAPREGKMIFKPLRSAEDAMLECLFFGKYLTVEVKPKFNK